MNDDVPAAAFDDFEGSYRALFLPAMRLVHRMTGDAALAEDIAAETMARAYARWSSVARLDSPLAWVLRVATNQAIDAARRQRLAAQVMPSLALVDHGSRFDDDVAARLALVAALTALPRRQREAIALHYLGGLSDEEISQSLNISPSSVRTHLQRGLSTLRDRLGATGGGVARAAV